MKEIKIKYFNKDYPRLEKISKGDWIDLRVDRLIDILDISEGELEVYKLGFTDDGNTNYYKGEIIKLGLGVAMELPKGYEAVIVPRSSTFKNWGLIQTNSQGVIDNSYNGDTDEWQIEFIATRDGVINRFDRVCQFRIQENQPEIVFKEVDKLGNASRGGYGTTGRD